MSMNETGGGGRPYEYTRDPASEAALRDYASTLNAVGGSGNLGAQYLPQSTQPQKAAATKWTPTPFNAQTPDYQFGATPQVDTNPWNPLGSAGFSTAAPQVQQSDYTAPTGNQTYYINPESGLEVPTDYGFGEYIAAISDQLYAGEGRRLDAAAEASASRGMLRSGAAILSEDAVRRETELEIAVQTATAAVEQARLTQDTMVAAATLRTEREMSNQRATEAWQQLQEQAEQYQATLEQQRQISNQQAFIEMSGQARDYAAQMSGLETQRALANQDAELLYTQIQVGYNQFQKELEFNEWATNQATQFDYAELGQNAALTQQSLAAQYGGGGGGSIPWDDITQSALQYDMPKYQLQTAMSAMYPDYYDAIPSQNPSLANILGLGTTMTADEERLRAEIAALNR